MNKHPVLMILFLLFSFLLCAYTFTYTGSEMQALFDAVNARIATTTGAGDAGKLIKTDASGLIADSFLADVIDESEIADDAIQEEHLKAVDAAADEDVMTYESTTGDFEWHTIDELIATVSAGAYTDDSVTSNDIYWAEPITVPFDNKIQFGDTGIYIWADDDGILDIVSDTTIESSAAWVHTGNFKATTYGTAAVTDAELGYVDTVTSNIQTQFGTKVTGPGASTDTAIMVWNGAGGYTAKNSGVLIDASDNMSGVASVTLDPSATPGWTGYDSDQANDAVGSFNANGDGTDADFTFKVQVGDALVEFLRLDGQDEEVVLAKPLDMGANAIATTGLVTGGVKSVVDADGGEVDAYCYGGVWFASGTGTLLLPAVAAGMQLTVENHTALDVSIDPDGTEVIRLNGLAAAAGEHIIGSDLGDGCVCTYYAASTWSCFCSGYEESTPP